MAVLRAIGAVRRIQQAPSLLHSVQQRHFSPLTWLRHKFQLRQLENQWDFDEEEFLEGARSAFTLLQDTIMAGDQEGLKDLKDGLDPAIYSDVLKAIKQNKIDYKFIGVKDIQMLDMIGRLKDSDDNDDEASREGTIAMLLGIEQSTTDNDKAPSHMVMILESPLVKISEGGRYGIEPFEEPSWRVVALSHPRTMIKEYDLDIVYTDDN
eukprot:TRINITY_DN3908_c0_g1_i1.p1 TRINITY_DN3908_c0_g1~~TRINITY_DN3908_c0_g1_i1.p1  ORF type:complete len:219 (+),score=37.52 TRINITY_DN3908_c0_g1_i1:31-657(+)